MSQCLRSPTLCGNGPRSSTHETWKALMDFGFAAGLAGRGSCTAGLQNTLTQQLLSPLQAYVSSEWSGWSRGQLGLSPPSWHWQCIPSTPVLPVETLNACLLLSALSSLNTQQAEQSHGGTEKGISPH